MNRMMFTNNKTINDPEVKKSIQQIVYRHNIVTIQTPIEVQPEEPVKKMKWGQPIWFLFHTLSEKVKKESFLVIRNELLTNIYAICNNLPCPTCSTHAIEFLNGVNFNTIRTKEDLKELFFNFHNQVNKKKGFPIFTLAELDEKYTKAVTKNIIHNFLISFSDKHKSIHMIANDMYRSRQVIILREWFIANISHFDL